MSLTWHQGFFTVLQSSSTKALQEHHQSAILCRLRHKSAILREILGHIAGCVVESITASRPSHTSRVCLGMVSSIPPAPCSLWEMTIQRI